MLTKHLKHLQGRSFQTCLGFQKIDRNYRVATWEFEEDNGAAVNGAQVSSVTVSAGGSSYVNGNAASFSGGGGSGAAGTLVVSGGAITSITMTNAGTGYTSAPTVTGPTGSGATLTAVLANKGTTRTAARTEANWKNIDDSTTAYSSSPITAGNNSYTKYQFGHLSGTYNQISAGLFAHTAGALGTGLTLKGAVLNVYATPATSTNAALTTDMTSAIAIGSGLAVLFTNQSSATGPETPGGGSSSVLSATTTTNPAYTQWLATQLQTTTSATAGDTTSCTLTTQYSEN
jgi:hypothetical protein